ncbi:MAG: hypothetical protein ACLFNO_02165 [Parcubacteria group bacterium]
MNNIQTSSKESVFTVTVNFTEALIRLKKDEKLLNSIKKSEDSHFKGKMLDSIIRKSFTVRLISLKNKREMYDISQQGEYSPATVFELLPFLHQFPKYRSFNIAAEGSWWKPTVRDLFYITNKVRDDKNKITLGYKCFNYCCLEERTKEEFYVLELKN